jgi:hypothetical protein
MVRPHPAESPKTGLFCGVHQPATDMTSAIGSDRQTVDAMQASNSHLGFE